MNDEMVTIPLSEYKRLLRKAEDLELLTSCSFYDEVDPWVIHCAHPGCTAKAVTNGSHGNQSDRYYDCDKMVMCDSQKTCSTSDGDTYYCDKHASEYLIETKESDVTYRTCHSCQRNESKVYGPSGLSGTL